MQSENKTAVALGLFDGVHKGHRAVIERMLLSSEGLLPAVFTFDFGKGSGRLISQNEKCRILSEMGVKKIFSPPFEKIKDMSPYEFAENILYKELNAKSLFCGENFSFGKGGKASATDLSEIAEKFGIKTEIIPLAFENGEEISSTRIKALLKDGDVKGANRLLGREYSFTLCIEKGRQLGRTLGIPTINQHIPDDFCEMKKGVYAVRCKIEGEEVKGVANIGVRPTVCDSDKKFCETYLFNFDKDIYGEEVTSSLVEFIRPERKFENINELKKQIEADMQSALKIFKSTERNEANE